MPIATFDNILVIPVHKPISTLALDSNKMGDFYGLVIDVGPDYKYDVKVGDKIIFPRNEGFKVEVDDVEYLSLSPRHVLGVIIK